MPGCLWFNNRLPTTVQYWLGKDENTIMIEINFLLIWDRKSYSYSKVMHATILKAEMLTLYAEWNSVMVFKKLKSYVTMHINIQKVLFLSWLKSRVLVLEEKVLVLVSIKKSHLPHWAYMTVPALHLSTKHWWSHYLLGEANMLCKLSAVCHGMSVGVKRCLPMA